MKQDENCENCVYSAVNAHDQRECRRHAPIALPTQQKSPIHGGRGRGQVQMAIVTLWPPVAVELWCGDYMRTPSPLTVQG